MPVVRLSHPRGALTRAQKPEVREGSWGATGGTVSALDVTQFIHPDREATRRVEIGAAIAGGAAVPE